MGAMLGKSFPANRRLSVKAATLGSNVKPPVDRRRSAVRKPSIMTPISSKSPSGPSVLKINKEL